MRKNNILPFVIFFPIFFHIITYYGFQSAYDYYNTWENPTPWYYKGIYGYRILSREAVDFITAIYKKALLGHVPAKAYILKKGTAYYHSLFTFNTIMAVLISLTVDKIFRSKAFYTQITEKMRLAIVFFLAVVLALSQFVVTHYDNSAILLFLITAYFSIKYYYAPSLKMLGLVCLFTLISTLNRETACLSIAFMGALMYDKKVWSKNGFIAWLKPVGAMALVFLGTYVVLRLIIPQQEAQDYYFFESITLKYNFTMGNQIAGWTFGLLLIFFIFYYAFSAENKRLMKQFLFFSSPYILMIFLVGILWEIRLFMPLIFGITLLAFLDTKNNLLAQKTL